MAIVGGEKKNLMVLKHIKSLTDWENEIKRDKKKKTFEIMDSLKEEHRGIDLYNIAGIYSLIVPKQNSRGLAIS